MARIAGVDLPKNKRVIIGLTYIYGIGKSSAKKILNEAKIDENIRVGDLDDEQTKKTAPLDPEHCLDFLHALDLYSMQLERDWR